MNTVDHDGIGDINIHITAKLIPGVDYGINAWIARETDCI